MVDEKIWSIKGAYTEGELTKVFQTVRNAQGGFNTIVFDENKVVFQYEESVFSILYSDIDTYFIKKGLVVIKLKSGKIYTFWLRHRGRKGSVSTNNAKKFVKALDELTSL